MGPKKRQYGDMPQPVTDFYRHNEHLGSETRATEFKKGQLFIQQGFRQNVAKYVCGFINSHVNGKLLIGVNDEGCVCGYDCNHEQEDKLRRDVDEAIKDLVPPIFPGNYSVEFVPVCNENDEPIENLKVIAIMVQGADMEVKDQLYCNKQGAFMRRDGSIQELRANEIQEWMHERYKVVIAQLKRNESNWQSKFDRQENDLKPMKEDLLQKKKELDEKEMELQRLNSSMGHVIEENEQLKNEIYRLKENSQQDGAQGSDEVIERLAKMEKILQEQEARIKKKKSKVCVIS